MFSMTLTRSAGSMSAVYRNALTALLRSRAAKYWFAPPGWIICFMTSSVRGRAATGMFALFANTMPGRPPSRPGISCETTAGSANGVWPR